MKLANEKMMILHLSCECLFDVTLDLKTLIMCYIWSERLSA